MVFINIRSKVCGNNLFIFTIILHIDVYSAQCVIAEYGQKANMNFDLKNVSSGNFEIKFLQEYVDGYQLVLTSNTQTQEVWETLEYSRRITTTIDGEELKITLIRSRHEDSGRYVCMKGDAEVNGCNTQLFVKNSYVKVKQRINEHQHAYFWLEMNSLKKKVKTVTLRFNRTTSSLSDDILTINRRDLRVQVTKPYLSRIFYKSDLQNRIVNVTLMRVTLMDDGQYRCYSNHQMIPEGVCGVSLSVNIADSQDPKDVSVIVHGNASLIFQSPYANGSVHKVLVKFQKIEEFNKLMMTLDPVNKTFETGPGYASRLILNSVTSRGFLNVTLIQVSVADDGFYQCFSGDKGMEPLGLKLKLNVIHMARKPVVTNTWPVFPGNGIQTECDSAMFQLPNNSKRIREMSLRTRRPRFKHFHEILTLNPSQDPPLRNTLFSETTYKSRYEVGPGNESMRLAAWIPADTPGAVQEYDCTLTIEMQDGIDVLYSLTSVVKVLYLQEVKGILYRNITLTFNMSRISQVLSTELTIQFRAKGKFDHQQVLFIHISSFNITKSSLYSRRISRIISTKSESLTITLSYLTLSDTGDFKCYVAELEDYLPECGNSLFVDVEPSDDEYQVNAVEGGEAELAFYTLLDKPFYAFIVIKFEPSSDPSSAREILSIVDPSYGNASVKEDKQLLAYRTRTHVHVFLKQITVERDGTYRCFDEQDSAIHGCARKLNVMTLKLKPIVYKSWRVFFMEHLKVRCDQQRFLWPDKVKRVLDITLSKRNVNEDSFRPLVTFSPFSDEPLTDHQTRRRKYVRKVSLLSSQDLAELEVQFPNADLGDSGEYECSVNVVTDTENITLHSLIAWVTLRKTNELKAYGETSVSLDFNMRLLRDPEEIVHLKFCKESENTFTEVLRVNRSIMLVELLAEDIYNIRVMKDNYVLFVNLLRMTEALAGLYGCFIGREKALVGDSSLRVVFKNGSETNITEKGYITQSDQPTEITPGDETNNETEDLGILTNRSPPLAQNVTLDFNVTAVSAEIPFFSIRFRKENQTSWLDLLEVYTANGQVKYLRPLNESIAFTDNPNTGQVGLWLYEFSPAMYGVYKCFHISASVFIQTAGCGYNLSYTFDINVGCNDYINLASVLVCFFVTFARRD
ncbi:hypothetical protein Bpfe_005982 [Biomphalaria pfeifferi]|uniref:Immunoglobulin domain-containing protein n=1 Tax=Biomphalaria pfeifferi TaxID=112525 RepID=A0AAD8FHQ0_BIOPF|nr:hypothetical protein Bpfe_005982 [Biomphalaria pfeifferi]